MAKLKLTDQLCDDICNDIKAGVPIDHAAIAHGITRATFYNWYNKGEDAKGMAIAGIVCGGVGLLIGIIVLIMGAALQSVDQNSVEQFVEQLEESL